MCIPDRPQLDSYDALPEVPTHFSNTPELTNIPRGHRYNREPRNSTMGQVRRDVRLVYVNHQLELCPRYGIYFVGSKSFVENREIDKTMLLVVELKQHDISKWLEIDDEIRRIMQIHELSGKHGVCIRYYLYNELAVVHETTSLYPSIEADTSSSTTAPRRTGGDTELRRAYRQMRREMAAARSHTTSSNHPMQHPETGGAIQNPVVADP